MEQICETEFGIFHVYKNDFIGKMMINGKHFEVECIKELLKFIHPGDTVVDVGAHCGSYTIPFAKAVGPTGKVHSFEPQSKMRELLMKNVKANNLQDRVIIHSEAIGHQNMKTTLNAKSDQHKELNYDANSITNFGGLNLGPNGEEVNMRRLDSIFMPKVDLIKIDVEGAEKLVLYGARELIETYKPIVFYEQNYKTITPEMIEMFKLSKNLINFDIKEFFIKDLGYSHLHKIGANYLAVSNRYLSYYSMSNYDKVKEFTEAAGSVCESTPTLMNRDEVVFLVKMVMSELQEIVDTVTDSSEESLEVMKSCLGVDPSKHHGGTHSEVELIADQADGAVDAWIYMLNSFCRKGINLSSVFDRVHEANMAKRDPATGEFIRREGDGKILKPPGWKAPDIVAEMYRQGYVEKK